MVQFKHLLLASLLLFSACAERRVERRDVVVRETQPAVTRYVYVDRSYGETPILEKDIYTDDRGVLRERTTNREVHIVRKEVREYDGSGNRTIRTETTTSDPERGSLRRYEHEEWRENR